MKFKVGDKVRVKDAYEYQSIVGQVGIIQATSLRHDNLSVRIYDADLIDGYFDWYLSEQNLELVASELREKSSAERKLEPIHSGVLRYFPDALAAVARVSKVGNDKHNPGQPLHWSREKSNDHMDCVARHIITPTELDPDSGEFHLAHGAWRVLAALQLLEETKLIRAGIYPMSGIAYAQQEPKQTSEDEPDDYDAGLIGCGDSYCHICGDSRDDDRTDTETYEEYIDSKYNK